MGKNGGSQLSFFYSSISFKYFAERLSWYVQYAHQVTIIKSQCTGEICSCFISSSKCVCDLVPVHTTINGNPHTAQTSTSSHSYRCFHAAQTYTSSHSYRCFHTSIIIAHTHTHLHILHSPQLTCKNQKHTYTHTCPNVSHVSVSNLQHTVNGSSSANLSNPHTCPHLHTGQPHSWKTVS